MNKPTTPITASQVEKWKRTAKKLVQSTPDLTHTQALDQIARENGFQQGWYGVTLAFKRSGNRVST